MGLILTQQSCSWLGAKQPHLRDVICECNGRRTVLAIGPDPYDKSQTLSTEPTLANCLDGQATIQWEKLP